MIPFSLYNTLIYTFHIVFFYVYMKINIFLFLFLYYSIHDAKRQPPVSNELHLCSYIHKMINNHKNKLLITTSTHTHTHIHTHTHTMYVWTCMYSYVLYFVIYVYMQHSVNELGVDRVHYIHIRDIRCDQCSEHVRSITLYVVITTYLFRAFYKFA